MKFIILGFSLLFSVGLASTNTSVLAKITEQETKAQIFNILLGHGVGGFIQGNTNVGFIFLLSDVLISTGIGFSAIQLAKDANKPYLNATEKPFLTGLAITSVSFLFASRVLQILFSRKFSIQKISDLKNKNSLTLTFQVEEKSIVVSLAILF